MLLELDIRDFAIIEHLRIRYSGGFTVLTGETGAGKSIVVDALTQLLGERAYGEMIRSGADRAQIEGLFDPTACGDRLRTALEAYGVEADDALILRREIHQGGRSTARINGRAVPVKALADLGALLVDVHGQSDNASLKREAEHIELLDRYGSLESQRREVSERVGELRAVVAELEHLRRDEAELARRADMLAYQVEQIRSANLSAAEEEALVAERIRLANAEKLASLADRAYGALRGDSDDTASALDLLDAATEALARLTEIDGAMKDVADGMAEAAAQLSDAATQLVHYRDGLEFEPHRLDEVEDRLAVVADLKRKFGPDVQAVLSYADRAENELATITNSEERIQALELERDALRVAIGALARDLSLCRRDAAERLSSAVVPELAELGMPASVFQVLLTHRPDPDGVPVDGEWLECDASGIDKVAFLVSVNPGEPPLPLARVASGGETARIMLALKTILSGADRTPTLIFDEIDAGIGGRIGAVAGQRLWSVSDRHQVLCVTHLPQVAAYADHHFRVAKSAVEGRTTTEVTLVAGEERVAEITQMLGSPTNIARETATQLLQQSAAWKADRRA